MSATKAPIFTECVHVHIESTDFCIELEEQNRVIKIPARLSKYELVRALAGEIEEAWRLGAAYSAARLEAAHK